MTRGGKGAGLGALRGWGRALHRAGLGGKSADLGDCCVPTPQGKVPGERVPREGFPMASPGQVPCAVLGWHWGGWVPIVCLSPPPPFLYPPSFALCLPSRERPHFWGSLFHLVTPLQLCPLPWGRDRLFGLLLSSCPRQTEVVSFPQSCACARGCCCCPGMDQRVGRAGVIGIKFMEK